MYSVYKFWYTYLTNKIRYNLRKNSMYTIKSIAKKYDLRSKMLYRFCRQMGYIDQVNMPIKIP